MWDYNIDNSEYNIESLKDCLIRANIFLEKIKDETEATLTICKNEITSNRPVRELYDN